MASSTASAVQKYTVAILDGYKRKRDRVQERKRRALEELQLVYAAPEPAKVEVVKKTIKKAAPSVTMAEINEAVRQVKSDNAAIEVSIAQVAQQLERMMQDQDDEAALAALLG